MISEQYEDYLLRKIQALHGKINLSTLYEMNMQEEFVMKRISYLNNIESKCIDKSEWLNYIPLKPKL